MTQTYPFSKANALGWSPGQKVTSTQINTLDANAAQAADGLLWSDVAIFKNFKKSALTGGGAALCWDTYLSRWINAGASGGNPTAQYSYDGDDWLALTVPAGTNWGGTSGCASNGSGTLLLGGGNGGATTSKIRQSSDGGATFTARNVNASGSEQLTALNWFSAASLFIAGLSSTATTNIETSPDGITWTQRTGLPDSNARGSIASSGTVAVMLSTASTNKCLRSTDGVTWTQGTLPSAGVWRSVAWSAARSLFMAIGNSSIIATSADGITWSTTGLTAPGGVLSLTSLAAFGRLWIASGTASGAGLINVSSDGGQSWRTMKAFSSGFTVAAAVGDGQLLAAIPDVAYSSLRSGL